MTISKDLKNAVQVVKALDPASRTATALQTVGLDLSLYRRLMVVINIGTWTDGTFTPNIATSATLGGTYVSDPAVVEAFVPWSSAPASNTIQIVDIDVDSVANRFLKVNVTAAGTTIGTIYGVTIVGVLKKPS